LKAFCSSVKLNSMNPSAIDFKPYFSDSISSVPTLLE
jgi:hypothetical protein